MYGSEVMTRDTYKYHFKLGNRIVHTGITNDLASREAQHRRESGVHGHIEQVGRRTTRAAALEWERRQRELGKPTEGYTVAMTRNPNRLVLVRKTNERSSTHRFALVWVLRCPEGHRVRANSCDAHIRRCPTCDPTARPEEP